MENSTVFGHDKQLEILKRNFNKPYHNPFLIFGSEGIGKKMIVRNLIQWHLSLLNLKNIRKKIKSFVFEYNEEKNMVMEDVRNLINETFLSNFSDKFYKYLIIDNFETLNINSKNALLKTLEEPPKMIAIFLIAHNLNTLPKTIISRSNILKFDNLNKKDFFSFLNLKQYKLEDNEKIYAFEFCNGSPGFFNYLYDKDGTFLITRKIIDILNDDNLDFNKLKKFIENYSDNISIVTKFVKRYVFNIAKNLLIKNFESFDVQSNILRYFECLKLNIDNVLNIDVNNEVSLIFINFFKYVKYK